MKVPGNTGLGLPGKVYTHKQYTNYIEESTDYNILAYTVKRNNDLLRKLIVGQYSSFIGSFNPYNGQFSNVPEGLFSLKELLKSKGKKLKNLGFDDNTFNNNRKSKNIFSYNMHMYIIILD